MTRQTQRHCTKPSPIPRQPGFPRQRARDITRALSDHLVGGALDALRLSRSHRRRRDLNLPMLELYAGCKTLYMRYISCSFPTRCLMVAMTPWDCTPLMVWAAATAWRTGSEPKPSQFRPPRGFLPRGPTVGPR